MIRNILFVCTGYSARSIIAEAIINNQFKDKFKAYSAGSNPTGIINPDIKKFLELKNYNLSNYSSKSFNVYLKKNIKMDLVITVCNNANKELCPVWPNKNQIIHCNIEDPVQKLNQTNDEIKKKIIFEEIFSKINLKIIDVLKI